MLKIVMEELDAGEVAAMYQEGEHAIIMVSRALPDDVRCGAVNDLLSQIKAQHPVALPTVLVSVA